MYHELLMQFYYAMKAKAIAMPATRWVYLKSRCDVKEVVYHLIH